MSANGEIRGLVSNSEVLRLVHPISLNDGPNYDVLKRIEKEMRLALKEEIISALSTRATTLQWHTGYVSQVIAVTLFLEWTKKVEDAFKSPTPAAILTQLAVVYTKELHIVVESMKKPNDPILASVSGMLHRLVLQTEKLVQEKVESESSLLWQSMAKGYLMNNTILIKCQDVYVEYGFEFYGPHDYLVYVPQNQDAYVLLFASFSKSLLPVLSGPSGVGKEELAHDVAYLLGKPILVFEARTTDDPTTLHRYLRSMASCGGMVLANEVNLLDPKQDYYSAYFNMLPLRAAGCRELVLEDACSPLGVFSLVCICNPGFQGRDTIDRGTSVRMAMIDTDLLGEGVLYVGGFVKAREYSRLLHRCLIEGKAKLRPDTYNPYTMSQSRRILSLSQNLRFRYSIDDLLALAQAMQSGVRGLLSVSQVPIFDEIMKDVFRDQGPVRILNLELHKWLTQAPEHLSDTTIQQLLSLNEHLVLDCPLLLLADNDQALLSLREAIAKTSPALVPTLYTIDLAQGAENLFGSSQDPGAQPGLCEKVLSAIDDGKPSWLIFKGPLEVSHLSQLTPVFSQNPIYYGSHEYVKCLSPLTKVFLLTPSMASLPQSFLCRFGVTNLL